MALTGAVVSGVEVVVEVGEVDDVGEVDVVEVFSSEGDPDLDGSEVWTAAGAGWKAGSRQECLTHKLDSSSDVHDQTDHEKDQEYQEQEFGHSRERNCDSAEPKDGGQQCDDKEHDSVVKHFLPSAG